MSRTVFGACLLAAALPCAADDVARWPQWLEVRQGGQATVAFASPARPRRDAPLPSVQWSGIATDLVVKYQQNPQRAVRVFAYVQVAIHDSLVECARRGCEAAARPVAMHAAASGILEHLYPDESAGRLRAIGYSAALAAGVAAAQAELAWQAGLDVAEAARRRALVDGWDLPRLPERRPAWQPGVWRASPPLNMYDPVEPAAGRWRTWVLASGAEIEPPAPPEYGSERYWADVEEVRAVTAALTAEQKRLADDWNLGLGSVTPPGVWNLHAARLVAAHRLDAAQAARAFAVLNVAMFDAMIACWHAKYRWWTERPVTVIRATRDPAFLPYLVTPAHPSYVSGHSSASGAAEKALAAFFPAEAAQLHAMAEEAAMSRLYGGIHFRSDDDFGLDLGRRVAARVLARALGEAQSAATAR